MLTLWVIYTRGFSAETSSINYFFIICDYETNWCNISHVKTNEVMMLKLFILEFFSFRSCGCLVSSACVLVKGHWEPATSQVTSLSSELLTAEERCYFNFESKRHTFLLLSFIVCVCVYVCETKRDVSNSRLCNFISTL